jgi:hypothetical protein
MELNLNLDTNLLFKSLIYFVWYYHVSKFSVKLDENRYDAVTVLSHRHWQSSRNVFHEKLQKEKIALKRKVKKVKIIPFLLS